MNPFINNTVDISSLPQADSTALQPVDPAYKKVLLWGWMTRWAILCVIAVFFIFFIERFQHVLPITIIAAAMVAISLFNLWVVFKSFTRKAYAVRERDLIYRSGWIIQRYSVCPFSRIQHCSVSIGPFERKVGLASLSVFTAGAQGSDIRIPGLKEETAFALRDFIMKKTGHDQQPGN